MPVTITLPDAGPRFMSMIVLDEDQHALTTVYAPGLHLYEGEGRHALHPDGDPHVGTGRGAFVYDR